MALITHVFTPTWAKNSETLYKAVSVTADGDSARNVAVPGATADVLVAAAIDVSQMKGLYIESDQDITIETNSSSAPDDTLTIKANKPLQWYADCGLANPLTVDVTALYLTRGGAGDATVLIRWLVDSTV